MRRARTLFVAALLAVGGPVFAQSPAPEIRLKELESQLKQGELQQQELRRRAQAAASEAEKTRNDMVAAARAVQENEDGLSELETQMNDLSGLEKDKAQVLDLKRQQLNAVLTALQRLAFRPSEALIAQPTTPAETVRSAILLRDVVPRIESQVAALRVDIDSLAAVKTDIARQKKLITAATGRLDQEHRRLTALYEKKQAAQEQTEGERQEVEKRVAALASEAEDLRDLLQRLEAERKRREQEAAERAAAERAAKEAQIAAQAAARQAEEEARKRAHEAELAAQRAAKQKKEAELAEMKRTKEAERLAQIAALEAEKKAKEASREAEKAAARTALDQKMAQERANRPFSKAQGDMPFPARGRIVVRFGQSDEQQALSKGISIETREGAQVIAPYNGQIVFAGPFRGYGLLLIIEHGDGYHSLLAGMARIDGAVGQHLATGEPVGVMGQTEAKPLLYVEFRHNGQPVNPLP